MPLRPHPIADAMAVISGIAGTASYLDHLEQGLRIIATLVAIAAGAVALHQRLKRRRTIKRRWDRHEHHEAPDDWNA